MQLVEWKENALMCKRAMKSVNQRLCGVLNDLTLPMSVQVQVQHVIQEARDPKNLSRMFVGMSCCRCLFVYAARSPSFLLPQAGCPIFEY